MDKNKIEEIKEIGRKSGKEYTDEDAIKIDRTLHQFATLLYEHYVTDHKRQVKLKANPKGFELEKSGYWTCRICSRTMSGDNFWFDKDGIKCKDCQRMLDTKVIPKKVIKNRECWVADWQVCDKLKIHPATRDKMVRNKSLIARELKTLDGKKYCTVFIKAENKILQ